MRTYSDLSYPERLKATVACIHGRMPIGKILKYAGLTDLGESAALSFLSDDVRFDIMNSNFICILPQFKDLILNELDVSEESVHKQITKGLMEMIHESNMTEVWFGDMN